MRHRCSCGAIFGSRGRMLWHVASMNPGWPGKRSATDAHHPADWSRKALAMPYGVQRNPNYRLIVIVDAIDSSAVQMAYLEVRANTEEEASVLARTFLKSDISILSCERIRGVV